MDANTSEISSSSSSSEVLFDSLPYIDYQDADYEEYALSLIEHEMNYSEDTATSSVPTVHAKSSLAIKVKSEDEILSRAPLLKIRYMELAQTRRNGMDPPVLPSRVNTARTVAHGANDEEMGDALLTELNTAKVLLEEERGRLMNLELQASLDGEAWKIYNQGILEQGLAILKEKLGEQRVVIDQINAKRKYMQEAAIPKFQVLNKKWESLVDKRFRLLSATAALDNEVKRLKAAHPDLVLPQSNGNSIKES